MTAQPPTPDRDRWDLAPDSLDGHTIDELLDYLDRDQTPPDSSIDRSAACRMALDALQRLRALSSGLLDWDAQHQPQRDDGWVHAILSGISREAGRGRDIPLPFPDPAARLVITEGAVRGMIREAADSAGGMLIGRCRFVGDITIPAEPVTLEIEASAYWDEPIATATDRVRAEIFHEVARHTPLNLTAINITIHDIVRFNAHAHEEGIS